MSVGYQTNQFKINIVFANSDSKKQINVGFRILQQSQYTQHIIEGVQLLDFKQLYK